MKHMPLSQFVEDGYLQAVNQQVLHPLGLAIVLEENEGGETTFGFIWDEREDPEGIAFDVVDVEKARHIEEEADLRWEARHASLGYWVQPVNPITP